MPFQNSFDVFVLNSAPDQPSILLTNGQNLVQVAAIAFRLDKKVGWANAKSKHARIPQARSKLDTPLAFHTPASNKPLYEGFKQLVVSFSWVVVVCVVSDLVCALRRIVVIGFNDFSRVSSVVVTMWLTVLGWLQQLTAPNINIHCITRGRCGISKLRSPANGLRISDVLHHSELPRIFGRKLSLFADVVLISVCLVACPWSKFTMNCWLNLGG